MSEFSNEAGPDDWKHGNRDDQLAGSLSQLEGTLTCQICKEFLRGVPMLLPCGCPHLYCSECLHKSFDRGLNAQARQECFFCKKKVEPCKFIPQAGLSKVVSLFQSSRIGLLELIKGGSIPLLGKARIRQQGGKPIEKLLPLQNFKGLTVKDLKRLVEQSSIGSVVKLSSAGDKEELVRRYREFLQLHNEQVSQVYQQRLSLDEVIAEINRRENGILQAKKGAVPVNPESEKFKASFRLLIAALKNAKSNQGGKENTGIEVKDADNCELTLEGTNSIQDNLAGTKRFDVKFQSGNGDEEMRVGCWRIVYSEKNKRPFFYNTRTEIGQWQIPSDLASLDEMNSDKADDDELDEEDVDLTEIGDRSKRSRIEESSKCAAADTSSQSQPSVMSGQSSRKTPKREGYPEHALSETVSPGFPSSGYQPSGAFVVDLSGAQSTSANCDSHTQASSWICSKCTLINSEENAFCDACGSSNPCPIRRSQRHGAGSGTDGVGVKSWLKGGVVGSVAGKKAVKKKR